MEFHIFKDKAGEWRWHLFGSDRQVLAESACAYGDIADCRNSIEQFRNTSRDTPIFED
jgi:uncharacterized protein YegP (UPF0339 family)